MLKTLQLAELLNKLHYTDNKSFLLRISSVNVAKSQETADLITLTEEILNGKLHFFCSVKFK